MSVHAATRRRGMPLAVLAVLLGAWVTTRAAIWESPFALPELVSDEFLFAEAEHSPDDPPAENGRLAGAARTQFERVADRFGTSGRAVLYGASAPASYFRTFTALGNNASIAAGHHYLMNAAFQTDWHSEESVGGFALGRGGAVAGTPLGGYSAPFAAQSPAERSAADRWALDVFAFYRSGSGSLSTTQGRVPVYGASQVAANLQYRIAPRSAHDPRGYVRAYHALVDDPETELAAGLSARPIGSLPLRLHGEVRGVRGTAGTDIRPAGYAVTELPALQVPLDFSLETYAAAGYVGGEAATYFIDGQAALAREVVSLDGLGNRPLRLSIGGAAWGGAQEDAKRLDVGPTMRIDLNVGEVPARVSVDWRQQVAGDAAPDSGVAATVSTRF